MSAKSERLTSSASCEHYTDPDIVVRVHNVYDGTIDIDPFSCPEANEVVKAKRILTKVENGFRRPWNDSGLPDGQGNKTSLVNPPSTEPGDVKRAWLKAMSERRCYHVRAVLFIVFRIDALQSMMLGAKKEGYPGPQSAWRCEPTKRLQYWTPGALQLLDGSRDTSQSKQAMHGSCILLHTDDVNMIVRFRESFAPLGPVYAPAVTPDHPWHLVRNMGAS